MRHRRLALSLLSLSLICHGLFGQGQGPGSLGERISFSVSSFPQDGGNLSVADLEYRYGRNWAASLYVKALEVSDAGEVHISGAVSKIQSAKTSLEFFLYPASFSALVGGLDFGARGGLYISSQLSDEAGYFRLDGSQVNYSYSNSCDDFFYGPALGVSTGLDRGVFSWDGDLMLVPIFFFNSSQGIDVQPLVSLAGANEYSGSGAPYIAMRNSLRLFRLVGIDLDYEFQAFRYASLQVAQVGGENQWEAEESDYQVHSLTAMAGISLPIASRGQLELGYGRSFEWTLEGGTLALSRQRGRFKLSLSLD